MFLISVTLVLELVSKNITISIRELTDYFFVRMRCNFFFFTECLQFAMTPNEEEKMETNIFVSEVSYIYVL